MKDYINTSISEKNLRTILDNLPRLVMLIDLDGTILYWNGSGENVLGYRKEEVRGKPVWFLYPNRGKEKFEKEVTELKNEKGISFEVEGRHKDGSVVWLDVKRTLIKNDRGEPVILGTASDITLQKKAEFELTESKARTEAILETAVEGIITIDKKGKIQSFNRAAEKMFSYSAEEVIGRNVSILMPSPYREEHDQYLENYHRTGEKKIIGIGREVRGRRKGGSIFPIELAVSEVNFGDETIYTGLIKDISDRRNLENEILNVAENERRRIGQELHDGLGQMLSGISLISRNLARKLKANELHGANEVLEISEMIKEADEHAREIAHGLAHIDLENEGLEAALSRLCDRFERLYNSQCIFKSPGNNEFAGGTVSLHLYRIAQEAINNAIKHGKATRIVVRLEKKEGYIRLHIEDNGIGISDVNKRTSEKGMGIHTMRYRANSMGGNLDLSNASAEGTRVTCTIPLSNIKTTS